MHKIEDVTLDEAHDWFLGLCCILKKDVHLNVTVSIYKPEKTHKQLGILFRAIDYFIKARDGFVTNHVDEEEKRLLAQGLVEEYGNKKPSGLKVTNKYGEEVDQLIPIPLSQINRYEDFDSIFNGLFFVEAPREGVDMGPFCKEWEQYKKLEREKNNESDCPDNSNQ